jgi:hypothetical protein
MPGNRRWVETSQVLLSCRYKERPVGEIPWPVTTSEDRRATLPGMSLHMRAEMSPNGAEQPGNIMKQSSAVSNASHQRLRAVAIGSD